MASFTISLKDVIELTDGDIGLDDYPIFDAAYREQLNTKIIDHYWNREIGQETIDLFRHAMKRRMNEIMPYYNQLLKSELLKIDPFLTFDSSSDTEQDATDTRTSEASNTSGSTGTSRTVQSETPQTRLAGDEDYASAAQDAASESGAQSQATDTQSGRARNEGKSRSRGFSGAQSALLMQYRQTFLNVDLMIIDELPDLFMQIWSTGDEFSSSGSLHKFAHWM